MPKFLHPCGTEEQFKTCARMPALRKAQIVALIQGFLPRYRAPRHCYYLDDYASHIQKLNVALHDGSIHDPLSPRDLVSWAELAEVPLPAPFVAEVVSNTPRSSRKKISNSPSDEVIRPKLNLGRPRKKRPTLISGQDAEIARRAKPLVIDYVLEHGTMPYKKYIDKKLALLIGRNPMDIARRYNLGQVLSSLEFETARRKWRATRRSNDNP